jgi:serine/threonine protein kinase
MTFVVIVSGTLLLTPSLLTNGAADDRTGTPSAPTELTPGARLGSFRLEERCGEGGFGEVWKARQERPVEREVALKILKEGLHSQRARARFEVEQQALARLDHPHIARFFEGGTTADGRPWFAMEWIEGSSLTQFCMESKASLEERLRLFREVGEAVHHAHQKGLIHRDLKPSNVMVTANGGAATAKVIDFGIARAVEDRSLDQTQLTRAEEIVGTPVSMSPEQAAGAGGSELDARTDVYGLGVLLYELLSGRLPFDPGLPPDELRRAIREEDPRKPSLRTGSPAQARQLKGDLDWIVMRCLEKDPERRYRSVSALLRELERHAKDEPVEAGPPELVYRARKFVRRNRVGVVAALTVGGILVGASIVSSIGFSSALKAQAEAETARDETQRILVRTLHEKANRQIDEGEVSALLTLQQAVEAAAGNEALQRQALELWTVARHTLPGELLRIIDDPYALALAPDESTAAWCDGQHLHLADLATGTTTSTRIAPQLLELVENEARDELDHLGLTFSPDGGLVALHNPAAGRARVWETGTLKPRSRILTHPPTDLGICHRVYSREAGAFGLSAARATNR